MAGRRHPCYVLVMMYLYAVYMDWPGSLDAEPLASQPKKTNMKSVSPIQSQLAREMQDIIIYISI